MIINSLVPPDHVVTTPTKNPPHYTRDVVVVDVTTQRR